MTWRALSTRPKSKGLGRVHHDAEILILPPAPTVFVQRPGELYPGDPMFVVTVNGGGGGLDGGLWCMISTARAHSNAGGTGSRQGLSLVHFSAQPKPFLTQNTPSTSPDTA